jgi:ABC-type glutathione transport system ATPase component
MLPVSGMLSDSDNEDSDDEDTDPLEVAPHDSAQQRRPKLPIYHPGFQQAENDVKEVLRVFVDYLKLAEYRGVGSEEANYLWNEIIKNRDISYQTEIRIAVTGHTGSGKSATTNALLGEDLTPEGSMAWNTLKIVWLTTKYRATTV